ncbi:8-oxo-dGTP diphosphatase [Thalassobacillus pellis]|nr:8-oxo-dGTP diphosphatase [Thalassobacillus pellis]
MEPGESIKESVVREFREETGLSIEQPELKGSFTFIVRDGNETVQEWMMFTFYCEDFHGNLLGESEEGELEWVAVDEVLKKPMAEGDRSIFEHILDNDQQIYGTFVYTPDYKLLDIDLDPAGAE